MNDLVNKLKVAGVILGVVCIIGIVVIFNSSGTQRFIKSTKSNLQGGLQRKVEVYSDGQLIKTYKGKIDIAENDYGNKVIFELDGKRYAFYNCDVVVEEIE